MKFKIMREYLLYTGSSLLIIIFIFGDKSSTQYTNRLIFIAMMLILGLYVKEDKNGR